MESILQVLLGVFVTISSFFTGDSSLAAATVEAPAESVSVELGITELSPRGHEGGYAMPASGNSPPPPPPPVNGSCGTANGYTYAYNQTGWSGRSLCSAGNASGASFPSQGGSDNWNCLGTNGGSNASCSASRNPAPPTTDLRVNGSNNRTIIHGSSASLSWTVSGTGVSQCQASGNWSGNKSTGGGSQSLGTFTPSLTPGSPTRTYTYRLRCRNVSGWGPYDTSVLTVESEPNLIADSVAVDQSVATEDRFAGEYDNIRVVGVVRTEMNNTTQNIPYTLTLVDDITGTDAGSVNGTISGGMGLNGSQTVSATFNNVFFGDYSARLEVDLPAPGSIDETPVGSETADNTITGGAVNLVQPPPIMSIETIPKVIRQNDTVEIEWEIDIGYDILCSLDGQGISQAITNAAGNLTGSVTTPALLNETTYTLECANSRTPETYAEEAVVKVIPTIEEI